MIYLTAKQMAKVDKITREKYNVSILQMMENAGRNIARFVMKFNPKKVIILCGKGNNGGDGLAAARHLAIYGTKVEIVFASKDLNDISIHQLKTLKKIKLIKITKTINASKGDIIVDTLLGYNIKGDPREKFADLINDANKLKKEKNVKIIAVDIPSGMNPNTGNKFNPTVSANYTLTLALPKLGLKKLKNVYLTNIGIPNEVYKELNVNIPNLFSKNDTIKIQ